jgi:hypothetical protein
MILIMAKADHLVPQAYMLAGYCSKLFHCMRQSMSLREKRMHDEFGHPIWLVTTLHNGEAYYFMTKNSINIQISWSMLIIIITITLIFKVEFWFLW